MRNGILSAPVALILGLSQTSAVGQSPIQFDAAAIRLDQRGPGTSGKLTSSSLWWEPHAEASPAGEPNPHGEPPVTPWHWRRTAPVMTAKRLRAPGSSCSIRYERLACFAPRPPAYPAEE